MNSQYAAYILVLSEIFLDNYKTEASYEIGNKNSLPHCRVKQIFASEYLLLKWLQVRNTRERI